MSDKSAARGPASTADLRDAFRHLPPIIRDALVGFAHRAGLADIKADALFEYFAAYHVLKSAGIDDFDVGRAIVAGEDDTQLDAVAITINGELVTETADIDRHLQAAIEGEPFRPRFLFVQATMSPKFPTDKVALYLSGVQNFFLTRSLLEQSQSLQRVRALKDACYTALATLGTDERPAADVHVVWPGTWTTDGHAEHATGVATAGLTTLQLTGILREANFHRVDSTRLQSLAVADAVSNTVTLALTGLAELPPVPGVSFAGIGHVAAREYLKCITRGDPASPKARLDDLAFHGNVRAYLGPDERVNQYIRASLMADDGRAQAEFVLRNNGVTIIADEAERIAGTDGGLPSVRLRNYQIVNGCQTSHVLFHARDKLGPNVLIPIKIIATRDGEVAQNTILGLNRQTPIDELQIISRNEFVQRLKRHFDLTFALREMWIANRRTPLILFERRAGEYRHITDAHRARVVTLQELMQAYAAAFIEAPHSVHEGRRDYLLRQVPRRMFHPEHDVGFYFVAAMLAWRARQRFAKPVEWTRYAAKHQLVFALRVLTDPRDGLPDGRRDGEAHEYLKFMRTRLFDDTRMADLVERAVAIVEQATRDVTASIAAENGRPAPDPLEVRPNADIAKREAMSDRVLSLCLDVRKL